MLRGCSWGSGGGSRALGELASRAPPGSLWVQWAPWHGCGVGVRHWVQRDADLETWTAGLREPRRSSCPMRRRIRGKLRYHESQLGYYGQNAFSLSG